MMPPKSYLHAPSSTRQAFAQDRFPSISGPYRRPGRILEILFNGVLWTLALAMLIAIVFAPKIFAHFGA